MEEPSVFKLKINNLIHKRFPKVFPKDRCWGPFYSPFTSLDYDIQDANFQFYADDSVVYSSASSGQQALSKLQSAFNIIQFRLYSLKLVLNTDKTKYMLFSKSKKLENN